MPESSNEVKVIGHPTTIISVFAALIESPHFEAAASTMLTSITKLSIKSAGDTKFSACTCATMQETRSIGNAPSDLNTSTIRVALDGTHSSQLTFHRSPGDRSEPGPSQTCRTHTSGSLTHNLAGLAGLKGVEAVNPTASKRIKGMTDVATQVAVGGDGHGHLRPSPVRSGYESSSAPVSVTVHRAEEDRSPFTVHRSPFRATLSTII
eukprot:351691-Chlamydomonas_euryale.AAC.1